MAPVILAQTQATGSSAIPMGGGKKRATEPAAAAAGPPVLPLPEDVILELLHPRSSQPPNPVPRQQRNLEVEERSFSKSLDARNDDDATGIIPGGASSSPALLLTARQAQISTIPAGYGDQDSDLGPGEVVGVVLGSVAGFVLILFLIYTCINAGNPSSATDDVSSVVTRKSRRHSHHHHHSHGPRPRSATVEIRTTTRGVTPVIVDDMTAVGGGGGPDGIIVEEVSRSRGRRSSGASHSRVRTVHNDSDDEVVVIEEATPPSRRRHSRSTSVHRTSGYYREVDPDRFAGGDAPMREVRRSTSRTRYH